ncbi:MAG TPA: hypothetical protein VEU33_48785 [Archangium sp.]|nr:hypothetical protein [Archangium sp.]
MRWLHPTGLTEPVPTVALDGDTFVVDLPLSSLGVTRPPRVWLAYALASIYLLSVIAMLNG